jgi:hypothetical protein
MADYNNRGGLWKRQPQDNDEPGKKYPNYTGNFTDSNGKVMSCAMWINATKENPKAPDINFVVSDKTNQNKE